MSNTYQSRIAALAPGYDPRLVESWMRSESGTLDALSPVHFAIEVNVACLCIDQAGVEESTRLAQSMGLMQP